MNEIRILLASLLALVALVLVACGSAPIPTSAPEPTSVSSAAATSSPTRQVAPAQTQAPSTATAAPSATMNAKSPTSAFETKSNTGGSVVVEVKPTALQVGQPVAFEIAMNTHSVDLSDDMTKIVILRDDAGKEYQPTGWEGAGPGGHHRTGTPKFAALASKSKYVELVIKGLAKVSERVFRWNLS